MTACNWASDAQVGQVEARSAIAQQCAMHGGRLGCREPCVREKRLGSPPDLIDLRYWSRQSYHGGRADVQLAEVNREWLNARRQFVEARGPLSAPPGPDDIFRPAIVLSHREHGGHAHVERPRWASQGRYAGIAKRVLFLGEARPTIELNLGVQIVSEARLGPERTRRPRLTCVQLGSALAHPQRTGAQPGADKQPVGNARAVGRLAPRLRLFDLGNLR